MEMQTAESPIPLPAHAPGQRGTCEPCHASSPHGNELGKKRARRSRRKRKDERGLDKDIESCTIDESLSKEALEELQQAEECLKREFIYRLKRGRKPRRYPLAVYTCKLCDAFLESIPSAHKHIKEKRHKKNVTDKEEEQLLVTLPPPTVQQMKLIDLAIEKIVQRFGLNNEDLEKRLQIKSVMEKQIHHKLPDSSLSIYGSSSTRFGFKKSDLNLDIRFPDSMTQPDALLLVQESLKNCESFIDVDTDFHARVPVVVCREKESGLLCKVSAGNESACLTTKYLAALGSLEPKLIPLVVSFRYWAKLCHIDSPEEGGLPPYVFALMTVFFLQQRSNPVLPVYLGSWIEGFSLRKLGKFYLADVENNEVIWEYNPAADDDTHPPVEECTKRGSVPLVIDKEHRCSIPVGQLWVELLRFYTVEFKFEDLIINVRFKELILRELKDWPKKRIAVEDPFSVKWNAARSLNSQLVFEYILHCLRVTYKYFASPHSKSTNSDQRKPVDTDLKRTLLPESEQCSKDTNNVPVGNDIPALNRKLEDVTIKDPVNTLSSHNDFKNNVDNIVDCSDSQTEEELVDIGNIDSHCLAEAVTLNDLQEYKPHSDDAESCNEEFDGVKRVNICVTHDETLEYSENGEPAIHHLECDAETDSISDVEFLPNALMTESDEGGPTDDKVDLEEGSTEGTDELEVPLSTCAISRHKHILTQKNSDEEDEEQETVLLNQRNQFDTLPTDEDVDNAYAASGDEALSEEEEEMEDEEEEEEQEEEEEEEGLSECVTFKCQNFEDLPKIVNEHAKTDCLSKEDLTLLSNDFSADNLVEEELDFVYKFSRRIFTKGKSPTVVCSLCKRDGHLKKDCPEDFKKIELDPLPKMTSKFQMILDQVCIQCFNDFSPDALEDQAREYIRNNLENFIKQEFQGTTLSLFGSSKNGFGFKQSDLDICMRLDGHETAEDLDCVRIIEDLARVLRKHSGLRNILPITTAKVPIVKFFHVRSGLEGDISLYNTLALHNTRLLSAYAAFDPRVKHLCYIMKVFTKMCDIGDASRGSLSSYAYTLMVIYFLQQRNPPVIPVLQEIYTGQKKPEIMVEGWNVYFFDKLDELSNDWPSYGKNKESVGELWLGLLRFYTEEFDFKEHVICIRRKSLLTTFKKQWTSKYIVIEDPFDLNHNLGAGLSRKMAYFIMKAFMNGRRLFGTPVKSFPKEYPTKMEYFFDPEVLTEGELAPNDRCCRICGKIGHFLRECPMRRKHRRRWENEGNMNQRYSEKNLQKNDKDKDAPSKNFEKDVPGRDGRIQPPCTPPKHRQGVWAGQETGRENASRHSTERRRRQEDRDFKDKNCFICGREGHIKKACPQYRPSGGSKSDTLGVSPSSPSSVKHASRLHQEAYPVKLWPKEKSCKKSHHKNPEGLELFMRL
ncbi:terminal uridylyltransferase 7 isoform X2 [Ambystoma mexicanum]|uniref:terminal uridylyltransferase 7 isoform X2 n=1 Tax=Ambystoma mexicanum TaxID=8296 RepID=UPI0037E935DC